MFRNERNKLNRQYVERTFKDFEVGQSGWTVPWALNIDDDRNAFLNIDFTSRETPGGTVQMFVEKTNEGWYCDITRCRDHGWRLGGNIGVVSTVTLESVHELRQ